eukprot:CAMPEP_0173381352 /NCGR_PEP_ID=MMETSP1356-20130122/3721_1 /TAXON_ID=77927 ORGANISM="Hemiselmis virescens, Strain PCC157" /NCGR_SAMPLE_ID=MMETSP1356 /ASSEMBLY_ACC=CAM_ASM_000847 /LENGTH=90 /DNA_ID=CAMNT_0014335125 /DNA_START=120 /DNA_END=392 /DNA_ORIENTATION=+
MHKPVAAHAPFDVDRFAHSPAIRPSDAGAREEAARERVEAALAPPAQPPLRQDLLSEAVGIRYAAAAAAHGQPRLLRLPHAAAQQPRRPL